MNKHILLLLLSMGAAQAAELHIYPSFTEVREPIEVKDGQYTFSIPQADLCQIYPSSIGLRNARVESYRVGTRTVPWVDQLLGKRVAVREGSGVKPAVVVQVQGDRLMVKDEVTGRFYATSLASIEYFELPSTFQDRTEVSYQFKVGENNGGQLQYLTRAVSWKPIYTLDVQGDQAVLRAWGEITNNTSQLLKADKATLFGGSVNKGGQLFPGCGGYQPQPQAYLREEADFEGVANVAPAGYAPPIEAPQATEGGIYQYPVKISFEVPAKSTFALPLQESQVTRVQRILTHSQNFAASNQQGVFARTYQFEAPEFLLGGQFTVRDADLFMGDAFVVNTPKGKDAVVRVGNAPEATYQRKVTVLSDRRVDVDNETRRQTSYQVTLVLKNFRDGPVQIDYQENLRFNDQKVSVEQSTSGLEVEGSLVAFKGQLAAGEEKTLQYTLLLDRPY